MQSDELSLRVGQLGSARTRARLAAALRGLVELADRLNDPLRARPIRRTEIRANRALLGELAQALCSPRPLGVEGLAMISLLIDDTKSPLYHAHAGGSLKVTAFEALIALERGRSIGSPTDS